MVGNGFVNEGRAMQNENALKANNNEMDKRQNIALDAKKHDVKKVIK